MPFNTTPIGFAYADMELNGTNLVNVPTTGADKGVGIGAGVAAETALEIGGTYPTSGGNTNVTRSIGTIPSGTTTAARIYDSSPSTEASAFTLTTLQHYRAQQGTLGAGSAVTTQVAFIANSTLTGATNNYGFQSSINEGANRYNLYMSGTADNLITGRLGIGGNPNAAYKVRITGTLPSSANVTWVMNADGTIPSTSTTAAITYSSEVGTQAASFTCASLQHFRVNQGAFGAGSSVTNQYGFLVQSTMTGATNNYGFLSDLASGAGRWNFYAAGTADNYFAGRVFFTSTNATPAQNNVEGMAWTTSKNLQVSCEGDPLYVNRKGSDGALVNFLQDGTAEGSISVAGNTVSYNPFMGSHYTEIVGAIPTLKGTVLESLDELVNGKYSSQDRLPKAKVSDTVGSSAVYGVYFAPDSDPDTNDGVLAAALGASWVRIAAGVTVQRGDLLESNGDGCAKVQSDDIIRSKTIGKVTSTTVADTYADGSYIVPCVLYCG